jgi:hypothetical protein
MTPDDLLESNAYYVRPEFREKKEKPQEAEPTAPPVNWRKLLQRIYADTVEPYSVRMDAQRLLEVADLRPSDFQREYSDFIAWRKEFQQ